MLSNPFEPVRIQAAEASWVVAARLSLMPSYPSLSGSLSKSALRSDFRASDVPGEAMK